MNLNQDVLYADRLDIGPREMEKILELSIFLSSNVYLSADARPDPRLPARERTLISEKLRFLANEVKAVKVWSPPPGLSPPHLPETIGALAKPSRSVAMSEKDYVDAYDALLKHANPMRRRVASRRSTEYQEGVTELVEVRRALWTLLVARHFETNRILVDENRPPILEDSLGAYCEVNRVESPALRRFLALQRIGSLSSLDDDAIKKIRRHTNKFRKYFREKTDRAIVGIGSDDAQAESIAEELVAEYAHVVSRAAQPTSVARIAGQLVLSTASIFYWPAGIPGTALDIFGWAKKKRALAPVILVTKLQARKR